MSFLRIGLEISLKRFWESTSGKGTGTGYGLSWDGVGAWCGTIGVEGILCTADVIQKKPQHAHQIAFQGQVAIIQKCHLDLAIAICCYGFLLDLSSFHLATFLASTWPPEYLKRILSFESRVLSCGEWGLDPSCCIGSDDEKRQLSPPLRPFPSLYLIIPSTVPVLDPTVAVLELLFTQTFPILFYPCPSQSCRKASQGVIHSH